MNNTIPKQYTDLVGTKITASGGLFSGKVSLEPMEYEVRDIRRGTGRIIDVKEFKDSGKSSFEHPTFELLLKREGMKRAQWSRPFPIREVNLAETKNSMLSD